MQSSIIGSYQKLASKYRIMDSVNMTLLKIEGLGDLSNCDCLIYAGNDLSKTLSLKSEKAESVFIEKSDIKIVLLDVPSSLPIASISFSIDIIEKPGFHWMPLFLSNEDTIYEVPAEVGLPRLLIDIHPHLLAPVVELTESSETCGEELQFEEPLSGEDLQIARSKNVEMMIRIIELENDLKSQKKNTEKEISKIVNEYKSTINRMTLEIEKQKTIANKHLRMSSEVVKENEFLKKNLEINRCEKLDLQERLDRYVRLYQEITERENSLLLILEEKDKEIMKYHRRDKPFRTQQQEHINLSPIKYNQAYEKVNQSSYSFSENMENTSKNEALEKRLFRFKAFEEIDLKVKSVLKSLNLEGFAYFSNEMIYIIGTKRVNVIMKSDNIQVRVGSILKSFESFISQSCAQELEAYLKKKNKKATLAKKRLNTTTCGIEDMDHSIISRTFDSRPKLKPSPSPATAKSFVCFKIKDYSPLGKTLSIKHL